MYTLEITIQRKDENSWPVIAELTRPGDLMPVRDEGRLALDPTGLPFYTDSVAYGEMLGKALFNDDIRDSFVRALSEARDSEEDGRLRVLLFVEDEELKALHWERLCASIDGEWKFLAVQQDTPYSMYLPSRTDRRFPPFGRRDLRALLLVAGPGDFKSNYGLADFDVLKQVTSIQKALGGIACDVLAATPGAAGPPTLDALLEQLTQGHYTLLHIVCHGLFKNGETVLYLPGGDGRPVRASDFINQLGQVRGARGLPHLTFLCTCESANPAAENGLGGLGHRLVRELGMPAVVAMTDTVTVETAELLEMGFYQHLRDHGEVDRALIEACAGLGERTDRLVPALFSRLAGRPLFTDTVERPLTESEIRDGLERLSGLLDVRAPVQIALFNDLSHELRGLIESQETDLSLEARERRLELLEKADQLCEEAIDLDFGALCLGKAPPAYDGRCPFRGLEAFRPEDREFFFGREALVERLAQRLNEHNFLAVLGPSGSGKSSLVKAGLVPGLQDANRDLAVVQCTPGAEPLQSLEAALRPVIEQDHLRVDGGRTPMLLLIDQFEELFTLCPSLDKQRAFVKRVLELSKEHPLVITLRADFWGECAAHPLLKDTMLAHQELVGPLETGELRKAIELQAARVGLRFEADLASDILDDVRGEPGAMPLMQHALLLVWQRRHGRWLRSSEYRAIGGIQQAIAHTADEVYKDLTEFDQNRMRDIFLRLTRLDAGENGGRDTRRRVDLQALVPAGTDPADTLALVRRLADARLVVAGVNPTSGEDTVEVVHEALIRYWPRLRSWLDEDRSVLRVREAVQQAAIEWLAAVGQLAQVGAAAPGLADERADHLLVHRGSRLDDILALERQERLTLNTQEHQYVDACVDLRERQRLERETQQRREVAAAQALAEEQRKLADEQKQRAEEQLRSNRRLRWFLAGMALLALIAVALAGVAFNAQLQAKRSAAMARIGELSAEAQLESSARPQLSTLLVMEAARLSRDNRGLLANQVHQSLFTALAWLGGRPLIGHENYIYGLAFAPDGKTLASASVDETVRLWNMQNLSAPARVLKAGKSGFYMVAYAPDGRRLAAGNGSGRVYVWDTTNLDAAPLELTGHEGKVNGVVFTPDGKWLAASGDDTNILLYNTADLGAEPLVLRGHTSVVNHIAATPDGQFLASASDDKTVRVWDLKNLNAAPRVLTDHTSFVNSVTFSHDGRYLASGGRDFTVRVWDMTNLAAPALVLAGGQNRMYGLSFSPDGKSLAGGSRDASVRIWDMSNPSAAPRVLYGHEAITRAAVYSPDGHWLATGGHDNIIRIWDTTLASPSVDALALSGHSKTLRALALSQSGKMLASTGDDKTLRLWSVNGSQPSPGAVIKLPDVGRSLAFSPDGDLLVSGGDDKVVHVWDVNQPDNAPRDLPGHQEAVLAVAMAPDGRQVASASIDRTIRVWDLTDSDPVKSVHVLKGHTKDVRALAFSPDSKYLASGGADSKVRLWSVQAVESGESDDPAVLSQVLPGTSDNIYSVAFSPDGKWLAASSRDMTIYLWEVANPRAAPKKLHGHSSSVPTLAFRRDSKRLVSASDDTTIRIWDLTAADPSLDPLVLTNQLISAVLFSADGNNLITGGEQLRVWNLDQGALEQVACATVGRNLTSDEWTHFFPGEKYRVTCGGK